MASPEPAAQPHPVQESSASSAAAPAQEEPPQERAPDAAALGAEAGDEEEGECGFCLYMKGGGCKDAFVAWEDCVEAAQKEGDDMVERCPQATSNLMRCMEAHADYYAPVLKAEQAFSDQADDDDDAAAAAAGGQDKGAEPASGEEEKKETVVIQQAASSQPAAGEGKKE